MKDQFICLFVCILLLFFPETASAGQVYWDEIVLEDADTDVVNKAKNSRQDIRYLSSEDELLLGEIVFVDIVDDNVLCVIDLPHNTRQLWVYSVDGVCHYGYQIKSLSAGGRGTYLLHSKDMILYYPGSSYILGLSNNLYNEYRVFSVPDVIQKKTYKRLPRSSYYLVSCQDMRLLVSSDNGENVYTVFDKSEEYRKIELKHQEISLSELLYYVLCIVVFLSVIYRIVNQLVDYRK